jgi:glycosyltransferase involved in cell wall biosynthesis
MKRLLVYDDNPDFGGHQVMAAHALPALLEMEDCELHLWIHERNEKWRPRLESLKAHPRFHLDVAPTRTQKLQVIRNYWERSPELRQKLNELKPDAVLFIQGDIEHASLAVLETRRLGLPSISYIPMVHSYSTMQARLAPMRQFAAQRIYKSLPEWITIAPTIARDLQKRSPKARVQVVENGIPVDHFDPEPDPALREAVRAELDLPPHAPVCAMIGRVEFNQKCQDFTVRTFTDNPEIFKGWHLLIVGSGPDDDALADLIHSSLAKDRIHRVPWLDEPRRIYKAIDCLLLPSGYEGVPLVMLEALAARVPVIASDRDGMHDTLPEAWRFPQKDARAFARTFAEAVKAGFPQLETITPHIRQTNTLGAFQSTFAQAVAAALQGN